jgi:hypothetical protein
MYFPQAFKYTVTKKSIARQRLIKTHFRDKLEQYIAEQRFGKHRLKAAIVEPDTVLSILLGNGSCTFPRQTHSWRAVMEHLEAVISIQFYGSFVQTGVVQELNVWAVVIDCNCTRSANKSNHQIQNPLLLVTLTHNTWQYITSTEFRTGYRLDGRGSIPDREKIFISIPQRPDRLYGPPSLLHNGYRRLFPRE